MKSDESVLSLKLVSCGTLEIYIMARVNIVVELRLLFSIKPKEMAKMGLLAIWIDQR